MPHIMIEYSQNALSEKEAETLVSEAYQAVKATELFKEENIKVRLHPVMHYQLGLSDCGFMHVQCRIHAGKTDHQKQRLSQSLLDALKSLFKSPMVLTVEAVEMEESTYAKAVLGEQA